MSNWLGWCGWLLIAVTGVCAASNDDSPTFSADEIVARALEKARQAESSSERNRYGYTQITMVEEMDGRGQIVDHKEKVYAVTLNEGWTRLRLVRINGEDLPPAELRREDERETRLRQRLTMAASNKGSDRRDNFFAPDIVDKFQFRLQGREEINGRPAFVLDFQPKNPASAVRLITDRLVNQLTGTVWIDAEDFEVARIEIHMQGEINLWAGLLASLKKMAFTLDRVRVADGIWFNREASGSFDGRKLLLPMHYRIQVKASDFHPVNETASLP